MQHRVHTVIDSPVGSLTLVAADGALAGIYMEQHRHQPPFSTFGERDPGPFAGVTEQLTEYFDGGRTTFDVPLALGGTAFQRIVWAALRDIPYGETVSYGELAERIGRPTASRAVGLANGRNPVSIIVPCHRVVGSTGDLTGYGGGIERKRYLLDFERGQATGASGTPVQTAPRSAGSGPRESGPAGSGPSESELPVPVTAGTLHE
ncbi:methylated-DNA--protein-cysteine methyltransferase [Rugosimonospora africana]|uniref:Methylated-DNA--protein-cysteine methyltransferase n=1 Tax=Rugosimonospora africana TaxID=556532 RepID=A0A8J3QR39_9ACTN|nr:methylated-DNA--protein-cysteine methyltransferase [Rugosimonospora africana]